MSYWVPARSSSTWEYHNEQPVRVIGWKFATSDSGLAFNCPRKSTRLHLLSPGPLVSDSQRVVIPFGCPNLAADSTSFLKTVTQDGQLDIAGTTIADLLCVRFNDAWINNDSTFRYSAQVWEMYFACDHGLVAVNETGDWTYFPFKFDSLPLPLTQ